MNKLLRRSPKIPQSLKDDTKYQLLLKLIDSTYAEWLQELSPGSRAWSLFGLNGTITYGANNDSMEPSNSVFLSNVIGVLLVDHEYAPGAYINGHDLGQLFKNTSRWLNLFDKSTLPCNWNKAGYENLAEVLDKSPVILSNINISSGSHSKEPIIRFRPEKIDMKLLEEKRALLLTNKKAMEGEAIAKHEEVDTTRDKNGRWSTYDIIMLALAAIVAVLTAIQMR